MKKMKNLIISFLLALSFLGIYSNSNISSYAMDIPKMEINTSGNLKNNASTGHGLKDSGSKNLFNKILSEYKDVIVFISGIALISMIMFFIFNLIELGNSRGNPEVRQKAIHGLIATGIATAGLGSITLFVGLFYNMF